MHRGKWPRAKVLVLALLQPPVQTRQFKLLFHSIGTQEAETAERHMKLVLRAWASKHPKRGGGGGLLRRRQGLGRNRSEKTSWRRAARSMSPSGVTTPGYALKAATTRRCAGLSFSMTLWLIMSASTTGTPSCRMCRDASDLPLAIPVCVRARMRQSLQAPVSVSLLLLVQAPTAG